MFFSSNYLQQQRLYAFEYVILTFLVLTGLSVLLSALDLFAMYLSIELQSLSLFILCCIRKSQLGLEAGFKYFSLSGLASGFLVFGVTLIYGLVGSTNFYDILYFFNLNLYLDYGYY
jgi:NADH-quinone oxidoreductase subunit N